MSFRSHRSSAHAVEAERKSSPSWLSMPGEPGKISQSRLLDTLSTVNIEMMRYWRWLEGCTETAQKKRAMVAKPLAWIGRYLPQESHDLRSRQIGLEPFMQCRLSSLHFTHPLLISPHVTQPFPITRDEWEHIARQGSSLIVKLIIPVV